VRARWESLHAALIRSVTTFAAAGQFQALRRGEPALARFDTAEDLLAYLARDHAELDEKDQIYAALVRAVQISAPWTRVAGALAWCGLWPALDRVYRRRMRYFGDDADELTQVIWLSFTELMKRIDLGRVSRLAATLVRTTDRDVRGTLRRARGNLPSANAQRQELETPSVQCPRSIAPAGANMSQIEDLAAPEASFARELADLRAQFRPELGSDTDLLLAVLVLGMDQRKAAERMGLTYAGARQRLRRAVLRIRSHLRPAGADEASQSFGALVNSSVADSDDETG
jgi:DNA-directed RNA polymerase specialized sigma24 family protein